jgi:hypothetical protein
MAINKAIVKKLWHQTLALITRAVSSLILTILGSFFALVLVPEVLRWPRLRKKARDMIATLPAAGRTFDAQHIELAD